MSVLARERGATPWVVRRAGAEDERELVRLLSIYKTVGDAARRFAWIYKESPDGPAHAWLAIDPHGGDVVGFTSIYPRTFWIGGRAVRGGVGFDAFVRPDRRRRGIAAELHAASACDMAEGRVPIRFMCGPPAPANLGALIKVGAKVVGRVRTFVRPLRLEGLIDMLHYAGPGGGAARRLAAWADRARELALPRRGPAAGWSVRPVRGPEPVLDALWERAQRELGIVGRRDAALVAWRFVGNPVCEQEVLLVEGPRGPVGWGVVEHAPHGCLLVDYLLPLERAQAAPALDALVAHVARSGAIRFAARINPDAPHARLLLSRGFVPGRVVEQLQVLCPDAALARALEGPERWHFASGDLNPEATHWSVVTSPREAFSNADYVTTSWKEPGAGE